MTALIIEDEHLIAEEMNESIKAVALDVEVLQVLPSLKSARKWLMSHAEPDVYFMDIKLSDGLSLELFSQFELKAPVIFCTAYEEYAIRAFKVNGIDYLLKPVQEEELKIAIEKLRQYLKSPSYTPANLQQLVDFFTNPAKAQQQYKGRFIVIANNKWIPVQTSSIAVIYKDNLNYLYTFDGEKLIYDYSSLEEIEEVLDPDIFFRANRQTIIHINSINVVRPQGNQKLLVHLKSPLKMEVDVSREKAPEFKKWIEK